MKLSVFLSFAALLFLTAAPAVAQISVVPADVPQYICGNADLQYYISSNASDTLVITATNDTVLVDSININPNVNQLYNITVDCNGYNGGFGLTGTILSTGELVFTDKSYCKGEMALVDPIPTSIVRGNDFVVTLGISPAANEEADFLVFLDNTLIIPGAHRFTITVGQTQGNVNFISPLGQVGQVNITIQTRKVFDYGPAGDDCRLGTITLPVDILGTMSTNLADVVIGEGKPVTATLTLDPPAGPGGVSVSAIYSNVGLGIPAVLTFAEGQASANFSFIPSISGAGNIYFNTTYYVPLTAALEVAGSIFASVPSIIYSPEYITSVSILPSDATAVVVSYSCASTTGASCEAGSLTFSAGASVSFLTLTFSGLGAVQITFSAAGFNDLVIDTVLGANNCPAGEIPDYFNPSGACLYCPEDSTGTVCGGNGYCTQSETVTATAVCQCDPDFYGPVCQAIVQEAAYQPQGGSFNALYLTPIYTLPAAVVFTYPGNAFQNQVNPSTLFFIAYDGVSSSSSDLNPAEVSPVTKSGYAAVSTGISFDIVATADDNTLIAYSSTAGSVLSIQINSYYYLAEDFLRLQIYWADPATGAWIAAGQTCSKPYPTTHDLDTYTVSTTVCVTGQFAVFEIEALPVVVNQFVPELLPINATQLDNQDATTGIGGVAPDPPAVQPTFSPLIVLSPPKSQEHINSSPALSISTFVTLAALLIALWL